MAGWYAETGAPGVERYWDGSSWTDARRAAAIPPAAPPAIVVHTHVAPVIHNELIAGSRVTPIARHAHGLRYWILLGWWWAPLKWLGRVALWLLFFPLGFWRSYANHDRKKELRQQRGLKGY
ncbi:MAG: DUF2510 domain-containing protein [Actinobacteria bacterium]|nr:DUF2510 domain-containing protein [Actinomycetota bacterium]